MAAIIEIQAFGQACGGREAKTVWLNIADISLFFADAQKHTVIRLRSVDSEGSACLFALMTPETLAGMIEQAKKQER